MSRIRVVSLNCAGGEPLAAGEVAAYHPDIVLLQESPRPKDVNALVRRLYGRSGSSVTGPDCSILAPSTLIEERLPKELRGAVTAARVTMSDGYEMHVLSLRLLPQTVRLDLWSPDCWRQYAGIRRAQREQTTAISAWLETIKPGLPLIMGGDFNAPQRDGIFAVFRSRLHEAFAEAGVGWGNTIINETPMLRIDQVWLSGGLRCVHCVSQRTVHSDHRMVVCDIVVPVPPR